MELTTLDRELLDGLQVLTDQEIGRVQAHLAAGLPMKKDYGWEVADWSESTDPNPACFGCLVGVAMAPATFNVYRGDALDERHPLLNLAAHTFPLWVSDGRWDLSDYAAAIPQEKLDRLAALFDMEWSRRHPLPVETGKTLATNRQLQEVGS